MSELCKDCGVDTSPCSGRRGCRHAGKWEWYIVRNHVWAAAGMAPEKPDEHSGILCIGCLETRLGRRLDPADFTAAPINDPYDPWHTSRLASRLRGTGRHDDRPRAHFAIEDAMSILPHNKKVLLTAKKATLKTIKRVNEIMGHFPQARQFQSSYEELLRTAHGVIERVDKHVTADRFTLTDLKALRLAMSKVKAISEAISDESRPHDGEAPR